MSGPPPTPTSLKRLRGNPGKRPLNLREPTPPGPLGPPPPHLSTEARAVWLELCPVVVAMRVATLADRVAFELLCNAVARYRGTKHLAHQLGAAKVLTPLLREFGLVPGSRARLQVAPGDRAPRGSIASYLDEPDQFERFLANKPAR